MAENIQYKDTVFRSYFKDKHRVLSLYRAVSGDNSLTEDDIELNDLAEALVNGKRNDVSFVSGNKLIVLIEHQSTINYNMPLRFLSYLSKFYNKLTSAKATYNKERIPLPSPQFYVFYNGRESTEEISEMKLEDAFSDPNPVITLKVKAFDIRYWSKVRSFVISYQNCLEQFQNAFSIFSKQHQRGHSFFYVSFLYFFENLSQVVRFFRFG